MVRRGSGRVNCAAMMGDYEDEEEDQQQSVSEEEEEEDNDEEEDYGKRTPAAKGKRGRPAGPASRTGKKKAGKVTKKGPRGKISPSKTPASKRRFQEASRASGRFSSSSAKRPKYSYDSDEEEESEEEDEEDADQDGCGEEEEEEDYSSGGAPPPPPSRGRGRPPSTPAAKKYYKKEVIPAKKAPKRPAVEQFPPVKVMVVESIRALDDPPRKGSTLGSIKDTIALNWPVDMRIYDGKIKKFILRGLDEGSVLQAKGKGLRGRFSIPALKVKKRKKKKSSASKLGKKFDEDEEEYNPKRTSRDDERERHQEELERQREERKEEEERKAAEKASRPKKAKKPQKVDWEVEEIRGEKEVRGVTHYLVKFEGWAKPQWEPEQNVQGCDKLIDEFLEREEKREQVAEERKQLAAEGEYEVRRILEVKFNKDGSREFLIRWVGWGPEGDTWEPEAHLDCDEKIETFMAKHTKAMAVEGKRLREAPKKVSRLEFAAPGSRVAKRHGGFRVTYEGMDD